MIKAISKRPLVSSLTELYKYVEDNKTDLLKRTGNCAECKIKRKCMKEKRRIGIGSILALESGRSRYPLAKKVADTVPFLLHLVPQFIYDKWGMMETKLGCQYNVAGIVSSLDMIKRVYESFQGETSKKVFIFVLMYHLTLNPEYISEAYSDVKQYFIEPFTGLGSNEVVVDCGGYTGDTLEEYLSVNSVPAIYYIYEPDTENLAVLWQRIANLNANEYARVRPYAVSSQVEKMWFLPSMNDTCRVFEEEQPGAVAVKTISLDSDIHVPVTFIKMDIEGSERKALSGAKKIINNCSPKLAISIYHSAVDLWEIPFMIINEFPSYNNFVIRHHSIGTSFETVFYAWRM